MVSFLNANLHAMLIRVVSMVRIRFAVKMVFAVMTLLFSMEQMLMNVDVCVRIIIQVCNHNI